MDSNHSHAYQTNWCFFGTGVWRQLGEPSLGLTQLASPSRASAPLNLQARPKPRPRPKLAATSTPRKDGAEKTPSRVGLPKGIANHNSANPGIGYLEGMGRAQPSRRYLAAPSPLPAPGAFLHAPRSVTSYPSQSGAARREPPLPCIPPCLNSPIPNFMSDQLQEPGDLKLGDVFDTQRLEPGPSKGPQRSRISCRLPLVHHACPVYVPSGIPRRS